MDKRATGGTSRGIPIIEYPAGIQNLLNPLCGLLLKQAFEAALAKYPATLPPSERWNAIASAVPGKTRKECVERFKEVCYTISCLQPIPSGLSSTM